MSVPAESQFVSRNIEALRVPPHSLEAEQAVLGGLMLSGEAWAKIADKLTERDFYRRDHQLMYRAIGELSEKGMPCDAVTLGEWFDAQGLAESVGGTRYVLELANSTPSAANIVAYAEIVREKSVLRQLIDAGMEITGETRDYASIADSGNRMHRRFCPVCGVHLFSEAEARTVLRFSLGRTSTDADVDAAIAAIGPSFELASSRRS